MPDKYDEVADHIVIPFGLPLEVAPSIAAYLRSALPPPEGETRDIDMDARWNQIGVLVYGYGTDDDKTAWALCRGQAAEWRFREPAIAAEKALRDARLKAADYIEMLIRHYAELEEATSKIRYTDGGPAECREEVIVRHKEERRALLARAGW